MTTTTTTSTATRDAFLGRDERRIDGKLKVTGQAQYTADFAREGMLWSAFTISPVAHARIVKIDASAALEMPGVHAVVTGADVGERFIGCTLKDWPVLAYGEVRFIGEYVAAVAADTREIADAAAAAIDVEYEDLPARLDTEAQLAPDAPLFHPDDTKFVYNFPGGRPARPHPNMQGYDLVVKGDVEAALASADRVYDHTYATPRYHAGYIEPRATLVWIDPDETVHVMSTSKVPFPLQANFAATTGVPKEKVIVEPSYIGGEFGGKALTIEEFPLYYLAKATGKAVKHVRTHADDVRSTHVRHATKTRVRLGVSNAGKIVALDIRAVFDGGAYAAGKPGPWLLPGRAPKIPYAIPDSRCERISVYTNTIPGGFVRAPGDVQMLFAVESLVDTAARDLKIDPLEFRILNSVTANDTDLEGNPFADPRPREVLETLRDEMGWGKPLPAGRGRGVALTARHIAGGKAGLRVTVKPDGGLHVDTGSTEPGVGTHTVIQRVLAAELGIDSERITVTRGATNAVPFDPGIGGSKGTGVLGNAALDAAAKIHEALDRLDIGADASWDDAARALTREGPAAFEAEGHVGHGEGTPMYLNFAAYGVEVSVDRETGQVTIHDVVHVADVGAIINPIAHRGQIDGGFLMGLGSAMTEELRIEDGKLVNIALSDYKLPTQRDMPPFRVICLEPGNGNGPYGARAAGEFNTAAVPPAIANAIEDACGVRLDVLGLTAERIHERLTATA
jgi:carbon-monoxide dehydrogenase large subunit